MGHISRDIADAIKTEIIASLQNGSISACLASRYNKPQPFQKLIQFLKKLFRKIYQFFGFDI